MRQLGLSLEQVVMTDSSVRTGGPVDMSRLLVYTEWASNPCRSLSSAVQLHSPHLHASLLYIRSGCVKQIPIKQTTQSGREREKDRPETQAWSAIALSLGLVYLSQPVIGYPPVSLRRDQNRQIDSQIDPHLT
ncbi:hypothetical protein QQF64_007254 [Cirrhinus molitorella]|uniref:Uncharacterized protein n=1 Tax=Cirrhinus molitorella TaxID=172907 RepID=A0ABR3MDE4_9TELE